MADRPRAIAPTRAAATRQRAIAPRQAAGGRQRAIAGTATAATHHGSLLGNLTHDIEGTVSNIVPGVVAIAEHPVRGAKQIGHQYAQMYGPLVHGDVGKFWSNVHAHPLQPILDAATVATLGAGGLAKLGVLPAEAVDLTVPNIAKQAGQVGEDVVIRKSSRNPLIRGRQVAVNKALNRANPRLPVVGSQARFARAVGRRALRDSQALAQRGKPFQLAFDRLSNEEKAAWHLKMQQVDPQAYVRLLHDGVVKDAAGTEAAMTKVLEDDTLNRLFAHPSKKLTNALDKGRALSELMTAEKIRRGMVDELSAAERPYLPQRLLHGAKLEEGAFVDQAGHGIPELAQQIAAKGELQPSYVPHSAMTDKLPSRAWRPSSLNPPAPLGSSKMNEGTLFEKGMLNVHHDSLSREHTLFARHVGRTDVNQAIIEHAAKEPSTGLPAGYEYVKTVTGQKTEPYTSRAAGDLKEALTVPQEQTLRERYFTRNRDDPAVATDGDGHKLIVPTKVADLLSPAARPTAGLTHRILYGKPTSVWKHLVLGLRPIYFFNITLSQHILGFLQSAPKLHGVQAYLNHLIPGTRLGKLTDDTVAEVMPEQAHGAFSTSEGYTSNRGLRATSKLYQGVMPATLAVENWLRRLMIEGWANSEPEIRAALKQNGGDINAAMRTVGQTHPHVIEEISRRVDHAQGNYRTYNAAEQKLRAVIPFYGWDRHIVQSTYRLLAERPTLTNIGINTGRQGQAKTLKDFGELPTYLQGIVKLSGLPGFMGPLGGRTPVVSTKALGPFEADAAIVRTIESLVHGQAGTTPEEASNINPFIIAAIEQITGRNVATGAPVKDTLGHGFVNVPLRAALGVPQARLLEEALNWHPLGVAKHPTSSADWESQLSALLGPAAIKKLDVPRANAIAAKQGQRP